MHHLIVADQVFDTFERKGATELNIGGRGGLTYMTLEICVQHAG